MLSLFSRLSVSTGGVAARPCGEIASLLSSRPSALVTGLGASQQIRAASRALPGRAGRAPVKTRTPYGSVLTAFGGIKWSPNSSALRDVEDDNYRHVALNTIADNPGAKQSVRSQ